jgi:hypothetical protein
MKVCIFDADSKKSSVDRNVRLSPLIGARRIAMQAQARNGNMLFTQPTICCNVNLAKTKPETPAYSIVGMLKLAASYRGCYRGLFHWAYRAFDSHGVSLSLRDWISRRFINRLSIFAGTKSYGRMFNLCHTNLFCCRQSSQTNRRIATPANHIRLRMVAVAKRQGGNPT